MILWVGLVEAISCIWMDVRGSLVRLIIEVVWTSIIIEPWIEVGVRASPIVSLFSLIVEITHIRHMFGVLTTTIGGIVVGTPLNFTRERIYLPW